MAAQRVTGLPPGLLMERERRRVAVDGGMAVSPGNRQSNPFVRTFWQGSDPTVPHIGHFCRHYGHELDVRVERQIRHVDDGPRDMLDILRGSASTLRVACKRGRRPRCGLWRRCRCRSGRRRCCSYARRATANGSTWLRHVLSRHTRSNVAVAHAPRPNRC